MESLLFNFLSGFLKAPQVLILRALGCDCISLAACNVSSLILRLTSLLFSQNVSFQQNAVLELFSDVTTAFARLQQDFLFVIRDRVAYVQRKSYSQNSQRKAELGHLPPTERGKFSVAIIDCCPLRNVIV
ncbi:unnamed protein product [Onchocerca flexuosa]|uniref:Secreted protein n=1 Tax=Onchocerca flexuosa TaxID=387005 RepID=A0A183HST2_9BILA|nr:unnamed protein product [Onchocerca flexuosa]